MPDSNTYAQKTYSPDGVNREFIFDIPYLRAEELHFELSGVAQSYGTHWTLINPTTARFASVPPPGTGTLVLTRDTNVDEPIATFTSPGTFTFGNLNRIIRQLLFGVQESHDRSIKAEAILGQAQEAADAASESAEIAAAGAAEVVGKVHGFLSSASLRLYAGPAITGNLLARSFIGDGGGGAIAIDASDTVSADNGATVFVDALGRRWKRQFYGHIFARWWGARLDGVWDDGPAINAALAYASSLGGRTVVLDGDAIRTSETLNVTAGNSLAGIHFVAAAPWATGALGTRIVGDATLSPVVRVGQSPYNSTQHLRDITVSRAGGEPDASYVGIHILDGFNVQCRNVLSDNHGINWSFQSEIAYGAGISAHMHECYSCRASSAHIQNDSWPELYWTGGRIGFNGAGDYAADAYIRIKGGVGGTAGGPNTLTFLGVHFNQGTLEDAPLHFIEFVELGEEGVPDIDAGEIKIIACHVEGLRDGGAFFYSDASWNSVPRLYLAESNFLAPPVPAFALNAATQPSVWNLVGNTFYCSTFNLAPTAGLNQVSIIGGVIHGTTHITGTAASTLSMVGVSHGSNVTLDGAFGQLHRKACSFTGGSLTVTATGALDIDDLPWAQGDWTPVVKFGGGSVGLTYAHRAGHWQIDGRKVTVNGHIILATKGTSEGIMTIDGLPFPDINDGTNSSGGGIATRVADMGSLPGPIILETQGATTTLKAQSTSATGYIDITHGYVSNSTAIAFTATYYWR